MLDSLDSTKYVDKDIKMGDTFYSRNQFKISQTSVNSPSGEALNLKTLPDLEDIQAIELRDLDDLKRKENYHAIKRSKWDQINLMDSMVKNLKQSQAEQMIADMHRENQEIVLQQIQDKQRRRE